MEVRYPILLILLIIVFIFYMVLIKGKKKKYESGTKIANTHYIKMNSRFQKKIKFYQRIMIIVKSLCVFSIFICAVLISRPYKAKKVEFNEANRDIVLCMDISSSVYELDKDLVSHFKNTVTSLKGERFAISIFNTTSVTLTPLTDDYEYVLSILENVEKGINLSINGMKDYISGNISYAEYTYYTQYIEQGTVENANERGSSIIGDGLASCIYNFSNLEEDRTRIIILATDNDDYGKKPITSLDKAAALAKEKGILVFAIGTKGIQAKHENNLKSVIEKNGGKYYSENSSNIENIINNIEKTSKSLLDGKVETKKIDTPEIPFTILVISTILLILLNQKVNL